MTKLNTMYKGVVNSPETYLKENLAAEGAVIYVADGSVFGELPNLAVIGEDQTAETILVKVKRSDGGYDVDRAVEGQKKDWQKATVIARNFTNYDYQQLVDNIEILNKDKVGKVEGKGLSTKDYTAAEQTKLKGIEKKANKTEIVNDLTTGGVDKALSAEQGKLLFQNVDDGKLQIANAIIDKGQSGVSNSSTFQELATGIRSIKTGYGVGDIIKPSDVKVLSRTEEKAPSKEWEFTGYESEVFSVAVDNQGNVYTGDGKWKVMKISPQGTKVWEVEGNINQVYGVGLDSQGYVYACDYSGRVIKISPEGQKLWQFKETRQVQSVAVDSKGYVYTGDKEKKVMKVSPQGTKVWEFMGTDQIIAVALDSQGYVYAGGFDKKITKLSPSGTKVWEFARGSSIYSIAVDDNGYIYTADSGDKISKISPQRKIVWEYTETKYVSKVAVDNQGYVYESNGNYAVVKISPTGQKIWEFTGHTRSISGLAVDNKGNLYSSGYDKKLIKLHQNIEQIPTGYEVLR